MEQYHELLRILGQFVQHNLKMDETIAVAMIIDKLPLSWKEFKHTLKHNKEELSLVQLGSHFRIEESLRTWEFDNNPKGRTMLKCGKSRHFKKDCRVRKVNKEVGQSVGLRIQESKDDEVAWWVDLVPQVICQPIENEFVVKMGNVATEPIKGLGHVLLRIHS
ncbi:hypothetical protein OSB04_006537 [Centaurea solstitialis]|uniref:Zinc finger, CCHC-type n=1 Tax=Centaurea solstitialis TaxID=347529 RepID=A0AA38WHR6_9ASTR|nr:hypothetical protein OSB04_006537 [Centaurea solstitialis]